MAAKNHTSRSFQRKLRGEQLESRRLFAADLAVAEADLVSADMEPALVFCGPVGEISVPIQPPPEQPEPIEKPWPNPEPLVQIQPPPEQPEPIEKPWPNPDPLVQNQQPPGQPEPIEKPWPNPEPLVQNQQPPEQPEPIEKPWPNPDPLVQNSSPVDEIVPNAADVIARDLVEPLDTAPTLNADGLNVTPFYIDESASQSDEGIKELPASSLYYEFDDDLLEDLIDWWPWEE